MAETGKIVATTAISALQVPDPFTKYIFVDNNPDCIAALEARISALGGDYDVSFINKDVSEAVPAIIKKMPLFSKDRGLLSFCFVDPFSAELDFSVLKQLGGKYKMDFLVLLMLGRDVRTNFRRYLEDENDARIAKLIDDENWRDEWAARGYRANNVIRFMLDKFNGAMEESDIALRGLMMPIRSGCSRRTRTSCSTTSCCTASIRSRKLSGVQLATDLKNSCCYSDASQPPAPLGIPSGSLRDTTMFLVG